MKARHGPATNWRDAGARSIQSLAMETRAAIQRPIPTAKHSGARGEASGSDDFLCIRQHTCGEASEHELAGRATVYWGWAGANGRRADGDGEVEASRRRDDAGRLDEKDPASERSGGRD